jgi:trimethylamine:corrinoid methyltransferase-like protein
MSYFEPLSPQNAADIHEASLEVLRKTGFVIEHKAALKKLSDAGGRVDLKNNIAYFCSHHAIFAQRAPIHSGVAGISDL